MARKTATKTDLDKLQGTWNIVSLEMDGSKMPPGGSIVIQGGRFTTEAMGATYDGTLELDTDKKRKTFNLHFTAGPEKGNTSLGIYELDKDTWKICLGLTAKTRPTKFATTPGSGHALEILKRESGASRKKSAAPPPEIELPQGSVPELEGEWAMAVCVMNGEPLPENYLSLGKRVAQGNEMTVFMAGQTIMKAKYSVDRSKTPMTMDYVLAHGPSSGKLQHGIYELDGKQLKTCFSAPGQPRPTDFATKKGDGKTLAVWSLTKNVSQRP